jgi:hypothetical protein
MFRREAEGRVLLLQASLAIIGYDMIAFGPTNLLAPFLTSAKILSPKLVTIQFGMIHGHLLVTW